ncbi:ABC transporter permease [Chitinibacteraceae bacterium HSL-7]
MIYAMTRYQLLVGIRSRAIWLVIVLSVLLFASAFLAGAFSARQPVIVGLDVGFSALRLALMFLTLVWVQEILQKELDRKTIQWSLAYPISRASYLLSKWLTIAILLLFATCIFAIPLWALGTFMDWGYADSSKPMLGTALIASLSSAWLESLVILSVTMLFVTLTTTPFLAIALGMMFALAGRGLGAVMNYLLFSEYSDESTKEHYLPLASKLQWLLPDLSALDWRQSVLYGHWEGLQIAPALLMAISYILLFTLLALFRFEHKEIL